MRQRRNCIFIRNGWKKPLVDIILDEEKEKEKERKRNVSGTQYRLDGSE
jgi:hypothetical protein